ncbi:MAG TPA: electron transfer flavoprotein, partial [Deltaproteobacteria bacterium]|nr:electron transfer flavoprotein [Deltaproteobacteria bacterium]
MPAERSAVWDAVIVGAGLAGLAAAETLADAGLQVVVLERGDAPGSKNVTGGRLYVGSVRDLFPEWWAEAP